MVWNTARECSDSICKIKSRKKKLSKMPIHLGAGLCRLTLNRRETISNGGGVCGGVVRLDGWRKVAFAIGGFGFRALQSSIMSALFCSLTAHYKAWHLTLRTLDQPQPRSPQTSSPAENWKEWHFSPSLLFSFFLPKWFSWSKTDTN